MNRKLLILDDEPGILEAYRMILSPPAPKLAITSSRRKSSAAEAIAPVAENAPFEVTYVSTGEEALEAIQRQIKVKDPFVGGFFDVKLGPGIDGIETIRRLKDLDPEFLCVTVTAYQDRSIDEITRIFGESFADRWDFMTKPFTSNEILQKARNLVSNWDRRQQIKKQQQMLIQQERLAAIGTLARGIGHEFGNILVRIIGRAEIAKGAKDPKEMSEALAIIGASAERAGVIVRNLQSLVKTQPKREKISLRAPLTDSVQLIDHELRRASVKLIEDHDPKLPELALNRIEISQVFLNLLINATHAMEPDGGELKVRSYQDGTHAIIEVSDTGHGIDPDNLELIFEPLFTTKGERGTGIGLSVVKKIIENHNGRISVTSTVGKGTCFTITLPIDK